MPAIAPTFDVPAKLFVVSTVEREKLTEKLLMNRLRTTLSEIGTVTVWLIVWLPRFGKTLSDSFSARRYCSCPCRTTLVPRWPCAPRPPNPPRPKPPPKPPRPPPRPFCGTVDDRFWLKRTLMLSLLVLVVADVW